MSQPPKGFFITGTDTDVGKTVAAAWIALHLGGDYWKPLQSGTEEMDLATVRKLSGLTQDHFHPSIYELLDPLAPMEAAKRMGIKLEPDRFQAPKTPRPLIVEGAGGLMVPITENFWVIDLIAKLGLPAVLVSRSKLGTINHTLLSLEALRARNIAVTGVIMNGELMPHNKEAIEKIGKVKVLAEIPQLSIISTDSLRHIKPHIPFAQWRNQAAIEIAA